MKKRYVVACRLPRITSGLLLAFSILSVTSCGAPVHGPDLLQESDSAAGGQTAVVVIGQCPGSSYWTGQGCTSRPVPPSQTAEGSRTDVVTKKCPGTSYWTGDGCTSARPPAATPRQPQPIPPESRTLPPTTLTPAPTPLTPTPKTMSVGSGFMVSKAGHILTNAHVIEGCREVHTKLPSGRAMLASTVAHDFDSDLALLQVSGSGPDIAAFREGRVVRQGEAVVVVGFPLSGLLASGSSLTTGTVSALAGLRDDPTFLQITAPVQAGNSGGPLLDESGNVVGVVVGKLNALKVAGLTGDLPQNVNFAIHGTVARSFLDARGVRYETAPSRTKLEIPDVGDRAREFTVVLQCLQ